MNCRRFYTRYFDPDIVNDLAVGISMNPIIDFYLYDNIMIKKHDIIVDRDNLIRIMILDRSCGVPYIKQMYTYKEYDML